MARRNSYVSLSVRLPRHRICPILPGARSFLNWGGGQLERQRRRGRYQGGRGGEAVPSQVYPIAALADGRRRRKRGEAHSRSVGNEKVPETEHQSCGHGGQLMDRGRVGRMRLMISAGGSSPAPRSWQERVRRRVISGKNDRRPHRHRVFVFNCSILPPHFPILHPPASRIYFGHW
jgi:hypothetical protein